MTKNTAAESKLPSTRIYVVIETPQPNEDGEQEETRPVALIKTTSAAAALKHFVTPKYSVKYAEQEDLYAAAQAKIELETVAAE